jgi:dihydrodipicolinate synthase/N-acetylneuraminate lyase
MASRRSAPHVAELPITAMSVTPFDAKERLDESALRRHVRHLAEGGVTICLGSYGSGEGHLLRRPEIQRLYAVAVDEVGGRAPICAGALGFTATDDVIEQALAAAEVGVDLVQIHPPRPGPVGIRPLLPEIERYYRDVLEAVRTPIVLTNQVFMVGYALPVELIADLVRQYGQIASLIHTDRDPAALRVIAAAAGARVPVKVGVIGQLLDALEAGAQGAACFEANLAPRLCASIPQHFAAAGREGARTAFERVMRLNAILSRFQNPRSVKAAMQVAGLGGGPPRRPYLPLPAAEVAEIAQVIGELGLARTEAPGAR